MKTIKQIKAAEYYQNNKETIKARARQRYVDKPEEIKRASAAYNSLNAEAVKANKAVYYLENAAIFKENARQRLPATRVRERERYAIDVEFRLKKVLRVRVAAAVKSTRKKIGSAVKDVGCTVDELRRYLETKFQPGMTWDNHGKQGWHIDHIKPLASFDLTDREQFLKACHYTNLQPLWAADNLKKSAKYKDVA
jgi:hypothetical protein